MIGKKHKLIKVKQNNRMKKINKKIVGKKHKQIKVK